MLFWIPAIVLISILQLDMGESFIAAILINAAYSYITVKAINKSLLQVISSEIQEPVAASKKNLEINDLERLILSILKYRSPLSIGLIYAFIDYPNLEVKKIEYLKQAHIIAEKINK